MVTANFIVRETVEVDLPRAANGGETVQGLVNVVLDKQGNPTDELQWLDRNGSVPEGQTILQAQFEEVEQTIEELLNREEAEDDDDDDDTYDNADGSVSSSVTTEEGTASESDLVVSTVLDSQSAVSTPDVELATSQLAIA